MPGRRSPVFSPPNVLLAGVALAAATCTSSGHPPSPAPPILGKLTSGASTIVADGAAHISLVRDGVTLFELDPDGLALGIVGQTDDATNYDPYRLVVPLVLYVPPSDLTWETPTRAVLAKEEPGHIAVSLTYPDRSAMLDVRVGADDRFDLSFVPDHASGVAFMRVGSVVDDAEGLYGLGESYDDVNQRGKIRAMQLEFDPNLESQYNEAHVPIPLLLGTRGWGLFVDDAHPGVFDVASTAPHRVSATFGTGTSSVRGLHLHLFTAAHPIDLTRHYYDLTGYPRLPAAWALGPLVWRNDSSGQAQTTTDLDTMRAQHLPTNAIWLDRPYASGVNSFDFDPKKYSESDVLIAHAHDLGFRFALWHTPYLDKKDKALAGLRAEATAIGIYPPTIGILLNGWGPPIDFTNPAAVTFWQDELSKYTAHGVEGFKLDYGEDVVPGLNAARLSWAFADGSDERTMHGLYQIGYHKTYADLLPPEGGLLLCRHATSRDQQNGLVLWPGDLDSSFNQRGDHVTDPSGSSYVAVGGLPASVIAGLSLGPSGFPFYGADTGGYRHSAPTKELFTRWFEQTALSSVMQIGNGASSVAWEADPNTGFDAEMLGWYKTYTSVHLRLFPYEWTLAQNLTANGRPIQRPLGLAYPELGVHPNDEYLFGDDLLVAPVLSQGATSRSVLFPAGRWIDFFTGDVFTGPGSQTVDAPLGKLPLYLRDGAIVPMLRPSIDTLAPAKDPTVDSFANEPGVLYVRVVPAATPSTFNVYDGTALSAVAPDVTTLTVKPGALFQAGAFFEVDGRTGPATSVTSDGVPLAKLKEAAIATAFEGYANAASGAVLVHVGPGTHTITVSP